VFSWGKNLPVGEEKKKGELLDSFAENSAQIFEGGIFSFSIKFPKVPIKSSICSPKMFPIAPHFYLICFGQD